MMKFQHIVFILLIGAISLHCKQKPKSQENEQNVDPNINLLKPESDRLFDGESLSGWEITNFGPQGDVYVSGGQIVLGMGDGCTGIHFTDSFPKTNYEVSLEAKRIAGTDFFCGMTFPINDDYCSFIVGGWAGVVVGLSTVDGLDGAENETTSMMHFNKNEWYKIKLKVTESQINAWINDEQVIEFSYKGHDLSIRPEVSLSKPFGICTWQTTGALRNIYVKRIGD